MKNVFLIAGNFGIGKTSIVNARPHETVSEVLSRVDGMLSLGGPSGADALLGKGYNKAQGVALVHERPEEDFIIHSCYYQQIVDLVRYSRYHRLTVFFLDTTFESNESRIAGRNRHINPKTFESKQLGLSNLKDACDAAGIGYYEIDNNRGLNEVSSDVWGRIDHIRANKKALSG